MAKARKPRGWLDPAPAEVNDALQEYWDRLIARLGRNVLFVDTGAILAGFACDDRYVEFFSGDEFQGKLITSTFVVAETVRRAAKTRHSRYRGPRGERDRELAVYFIRSWLSEHGVEVMDVPPPVFNSAKESFQDGTVDCDLSDMISYTIVRGMGQSRIVATDRHFYDLGLQLYP